MTFRPVVFPQLLAWEPGRVDAVTVVAARPNFQDSVHVGYVSGLKKYTEYFLSVLCFTTPGDGPRSPPQRLRTHEDSQCCCDACILLCVSCWRDTVSAIRETVGAVVMHVYCYVYRVGGTLLVLSQRQSVLYIYMYQYLYIYIHYYYYYYVSCWRDTSSVII